MHKFRKTTLENGLRILTVPMEGTGTVTVMAMAGVGSRYETKEENGLSHFIEHMFFKGTQKRPTALDITEELDAIGGEFNAFTGKDRTAYYAKVDAKHLEKAIDVISDMYLNSKLEEKEMNKERGTIIQEINMYEDNPMALVGEVFETLLYDGNPLGRDILGTKDNIKSLSREDFVKYIKEHYNAGNTVVCVAGKIEEEKAIEIAKNYFGSMLDGEKKTPQKVTKIQEGSQIKVKFKETDQTHLVLGVHGYDYFSPKRFAFQLLATILGGNMSSRIFIEVREKRGLAYAIRTSVESFEDTGYLYTQAGVEHENLKLTIKTILNEYRLISQEEVSEKELLKAKEYLKGKRLMNFEASDDVASFFIDQEVRKNEIMNIEEIFSAIDKVTSKDILGVAKEIFTERKLSLAVIGPHKNEEELKQLLKL